MNYGFVRAAAAVPLQKVADVDYNGENIIRLVLKAQELGVHFVVFPELSITAYTCGDLFQQQALLDAAQKQLGKILERTKSAETVAIAGMPLMKDNQLFNCAVVMQSGRVLGVVPKSSIPGYGEFYEERWFASGEGVLCDTVRLCGIEAPFGTDLIFGDAADERICFGVEICEDLWVPAPPSSFQAMAGATLLFNLSASNEVIGKYEYRRNLVGQQSGRCIAGYVYASAGTGESTTDIVFGGHSIIAEYGVIIRESERFRADEQLVYADIDVEKLANDRFKNTCFMNKSNARGFRKIRFDVMKTRPETLERPVGAYPFVPAETAVRDTRCREIFSIQTAGLAKRLKHTGMKHAVIGVSGGLDSTLALLVTARTFETLGLPKSNIHAYTMPGFGTTDATYENAVRLIKSIGASFGEIDIKAACMQHFSDIGHNAGVLDVTYENVQARERTQILMDIANRINGLVIGTGDLSELALGWCTYNGDHMSMYAVNCSIPKTLVRYLVQWVADNMAEPGAKEVLHRILDTPISPELLPPGANGDIFQKTEEIIGPYELHDFFLYHMVRYGASPRKILFLASHAFKGKYADDVILKWLRVFYRRFFSQQFKRSCLPDGPKVGTISLSPRGDWRMPSDAEASLWLAELE